MNTRFSLHAAALACVALAVRPVPAAAQGFKLGVRESYTTGTSPYSGVIADLNGDGKPDIVVANAGSNTVSVRLGNGLGGFSASTDFATGAEPGFVAIGDLNGDGKPDMVVSDASRNALSLFISARLAGFRPNS